ncbi:MAG: M42 family metallopeptidase, partial [Clostridiales Family XIII bacterium]|nr:M42 family metallopeptidase [Clostridiales Family XIII bacterium]
MAETMRELFTALDHLAGVSGRERAVGLRLRQFLSEHCDECDEDPLGNFIFRRRGNGPKVLLAAHMDELGFIVSYIEENGMARMAPVGWHDERMAVNQHVLIHTRKGCVQGVTGSKPSHILSAAEMTKAIPLNELYADAGTKSRAESESLGIRIGDVISFDRDGHFLNGTDVYTGKSVDDRAGCAVMAEVLRRLATEGLSSVDLYAAATVQEEVGFRGAGAVANRVKPDVAIVLDVALAGGSPDVPERRLPMRIGGGPAIMAYHWSDDGPWGNITPQPLVDALIKTAEDNSIPFQLDVTMGTATDAYSISISGCGVCTGGIFIPTRYIHTAVGVLDFNDMLAAADLLTA